MYFYNNNVSTSCLDSKDGASFLCARVAWMKPSLLSSPMTAPHALVTACIHLSMLCPCTVNFGTVIFSSIKFDNCSDGISQVSTGSWTPQSSLSDLSVWLLVCWSLASSGLEAFCLQTHCLHEFLKFVRQQTFCPLYQHLPTLFGVYAPSEHSMQWIWHVASQGSVCFGQGPSPATVVSKCGWDLQSSVC